MKKTLKRPPIADTCKDRDFKISEYISIVFDSRQTVDDLKARIEESKGATLSLDDIHSALAFFRPSVFRDWASNLRGIYKTASRAAIGEFYYQTDCYCYEVSRLAQAIEEAVKRIPFAPQLSAAIVTLKNELAQAIETAKERDGKCDRADLITDERHGMLWDAIESATTTGKTLADMQKRIDDLEGKGAQRKIEADKQRQIEEAQAKVESHGKLGAATHTLQRDIWKDRGFNSPQAKNGKPYKNPIDALRKCLK